MIIYIMQITRNKDGRNNLRKHNPTTVTSVEGFDRNSNSNGRASEHTQEREQDKK